MVVGRQRGSTASSTEWVWSVAPGCAVLRGGQRGPHTARYLQTLPLGGEADCRLSSFFKTITLSARVSERAESPVGELQKQNNRESESGKILEGARFKVRAWKASDDSQRGASHRAAGRSCLGARASRGLSPTSQPLTLLPPSKSLLSLSLFTLPLESQPTARDSTRWLAHGLEWCSVHKRTK